MARATPRLAESWSYVLRDDRALDPSEQSVFRLNPMTQADRLVVLDDAARRVELPDGSTVVKTRQRQVSLEICLSQIAAIDNFPAGAPKPWPADEIAQRQYLEQLDDEYIKELGEEIFTRSSIGVLEKNSWPPEPTPGSGESSAER